ncbi:MAG: YHYH protein [Flavobacteriales bacterium]|nr:YHYH protein [Flavobacteriales bacterium]MCB9205266.1 YHYH protein [Flavobacteriales bacterium]
MNRLITFLILLSSLSAIAQCDPNTVWNNTTTNAVCTEVDGPVRYWYSNSIPNHVTGNFPNPGNPNTISAQQNEFTMCAYPELAGTFTDLHIGFGSMGTCVAYELGVAMNGLEWDPIANEFFENPNNGQLNYDWNKHALSPNVNLGTDMNDAHVQPTGKYHYHGDPTNFIATLGVSASSHSPIIGYAADGFPIYYKYVYADPNDANSGIIEINSCFQLKSGNRPGNGITAPDGSYDGTYVEDYEYNDQISGCQLDQCNGRYGVTPDYPNGTYYYVLTSYFPVVPLCLAGTPDESFSIGPPFAGCGTSNAADICSALTVDIPATELADRLIVYPIPNEGDVLNVLMAGDQEIHPTQVSILDNMGRMIRTEAYNQKVSLSGLPAGVYYIKFSFEKTEITKRFVKQ